jgi:hypothetical protein
MVLDKRQNDERFDILEQKIEAHDSKLSNHIAAFNDHVVKEEKQDKLLIEAIDRLNKGHDKLVEIAEANRDSWKVALDIYTTSNNLRKFAWWLGGFGLFVGFATWVIIQIPILIPLFEK